MAHFCYFVCFYIRQAGYPGFARGRTLPLFRVNKLITFLISVNISNISIKLKLRVKKCVLCIKEACMYTLRYTYESSMVVTNYLLDNSNGENVTVYCKIKIGTWYNAAFIRGFLSNPLKSLVRF